MVAGVRADEFALEEVTDCGLEGLPVVIGQAFGEFAGEDQDRLAGTERLVAEEAAEEFVVHAAGVWEGGLQFGVPRQLDEQLYDEFCDQELAEGRVQELVSTALLPIRPGVVDEHELAQDPIGHAERLDCRRRGGRRL